MAKRIPVTASGGPVSVSVFAGETFFIDFTCLDADNNYAPLDLTGGQLLISVRAPDGSTIISHQATITDGPSGSASQLFTSGDTLTHPDTTCEWDVWFTGPAPAAQRRPMITLSLFRVGDVIGQPGQQVTNPTPETPLAQGPAGPAGAAGPQGPAGPAGASGSAALASMAALRSFAAPSASPAAVKTTGYHMDGDYGGDFYWDAASTLPDDGGLTIRPASIASGAPGRWRRIFQRGHIDPKWFGAVGDDASHPLSDSFATLADARAIYPHATALTNEIDWIGWQAAVNACGAALQGPARNAFGGTIKPSKGAYLWDQPLTCKGMLGLTLLGDGAGWVGTSNGLGGASNNGSITVTYTGNTAKRIIDFRSSFSCSVRGLSIIYSDPTFHGDVVDISHSNAGDTQAFNFLYNSVSGGLAVNPGEGARSLLYMGNAISSNVIGNIFQVGVRGVLFRENDGSYSNAHTVDRNLFVYNKIAVSSAGEACNIVNNRFEGSAGKMLAAYMDEYTDVTAKPACTFTFDAATQTITRSSGSWIAAGNRFFEGMRPSAFEEIGGLNVKQLNAIKAGGLTATVMQLLQVGDVGYDPLSAVVNEVRASDCKIYATSIVHDQPSPTTEATPGVQFVFDATAHTLARDNGSWIDDLVFIGEDLTLTGTASNNGPLPRVGGISADGKTLYFGPNSLTFTGNTVTRNDGRAFALDGWTSGMLLTVAGTSSNNGNYGAVTVAGNVLTVAGAAFVNETIATADVYSLVETRFQARTVGSAGAPFVDETTTAGRILQNFGAGPMHFGGNWCGDQFRPDTYLQFGAGSGISIDGANHFVGNLRVASFRQEATGISITGGNHLVTLQEPFEFRAPSSGVAIKGNANASASADLYIARDVFDHFDVSSNSPSDNGPYANAVSMTLKAWVASTRDGATLAKTGAASGDSSVPLILRLQQGADTVLSLGAFLDDNSIENALVQSSIGALLINFIAGHVKMCGLGNGFVDIGHHYRDFYTDPKSLLHVGGAISTPYYSPAGDWTPDFMDSCVDVDATAGAANVPLVDASTCRGREYRIGKVDASANTVTITPSGGQLINGAPTLVLTAQWECVTVKSTDTGWRIVARA